MNASELLRRRVDLRRRAAAVAEAYPVTTYVPHQGGQAQFHAAPHTVRALYPGNGFGKTRAAGSEVAYYIYRLHPHLTPPDWPLIVVWCAETFKQFKILRSQLESECFGPRRGPVYPHGWLFNQSDNVYTWPGGDQMFLVSGDSDWRHVQGVNPDLVVFDEEPPAQMWREFQMRRRGKRKTRYIFAATATGGMTWMYDEIYLPWLDHHKLLQLTETQAIHEQKHPTIWCWPTGGIADNPGADQSDRDWYTSRRFGSKAEKAVRLGGGFRDFAGQMVFDEEGLELQRRGLAEGRDGQLRLAMSRWLFDSMATPAGRTTVWEEPEPGQRYVIGFDSAYGIQSDKSDFDYAVVLRVGDGVQVAEAQGKWGSSWDQILAGLHFYFNNAFLCGERQVGLFAMQRLWDRGIQRMYFERDQNKVKRGRDESARDKLGHPKHVGDLVIPDLRAALGARDLAGRLIQPTVQVRSRELLRQLTRYQFLSRTAKLSIEEVRDYQTVMGAPPGDHDDGVLGLAYAVMGLRELPAFEEVKRRPTSEDTRDWHPGDPETPAIPEPFKRKK
jgi:hypothetical protein